jgi:pyruvate dehydrogenase E2 component (dihydrolipoamide acetyltransferase)
MAIEITVPRLGWSMEEGTFAGWLKRDGELVRKGDLLFALEGDKATQEIESFDEGILRCLPDGPRAGDVVHVGQLLAHLVSGAESPGFAAPQATALEGEARKGPDSSVETGLPLDRAVRDTDHSRSAVSSSPRARRRAAELGVDWTRLTGSGKGGRVRERDVIAASGAGKPPATAPAPREGVASPRPLSPIRRAIAERMVSSLRTTAPVTLTTTADASNLVNLRDQFRASATGGDATVPSYTELITKLTAIELRSHPEFNARWDEGGIVLLPEIHIAVAVDTDAGLLTPVIRDADRLGLRDLVARSRELIALAREGRLASDRMRGGTFTVTNLGAYGIDAFTPIINPPQCAILGLGRIRTEPVFLDGQFVPRQVITLSLTFDHRIADGGPAARFLQSLGRSIENPASRLIG